MAIAYTDNIIPIMTNYTTNGVTVSASSEYGSSFSAWKAFDNILDTTGAGNSWATSGHITTGWIKVDFGIKKKVAKYSLKSRSLVGALDTNPKAWTFEGSNDNSNWIVLDTKTNEINWNLGEKREYIINNSTAYRYYRLNISSNNGNSLDLDIDEIEMFSISNKYLLKQNSNYYTINSTNYDSTTTHNFMPLTLTGGISPNKSDIETFGFNSLNVLTNNITIGNDTFKPIDKFDNTAELKMYKPI